MGGRRWIGLIVVLAACGSDGGAEGQQLVRVIDVVDGDTVRIDFDGREELVRLIGVDTPETVHPDRPVECFGPEASQFTRSLLPAGTAVRVDRDIVDRDDYGRLLGYVHRNSDGLFVNEALVAEGYAVPLRIEPNTTYAQSFVEAARAAEAAGLGLWGACGQ